MRTLFYKAIIFLSKKLGLWIFHTIAWIICTGYFFFFPFRVATGVKFYRTVFPERNRLYCLLCAWRQFHNFSSLFLDRFLLIDHKDISYTSKGWDYLEKAEGSGTGGIIIMSHLGNWEIAAQLFKRRGLRLLLFMGVKEKEQIESIQKKDLQKSGVNIIAIERNSSSPFNIIEGLNFIKSGGMVSLTGDRLWDKSQRSVSVKFFGHKVNLPETPHIFALLSKAPLFVFFVIRTGKKKYHIEISKPMYVSDENRAERKKVIQESAQKYADILKKTVCSYPSEWYHFEPFLGEKLND